MKSCGTGKHGPFYHQVVTTDFGEGDESVAMVTCERCGSSANGFSPPHGTMTAHDERGQDDRK